MTVRQSIRNTPTGSRFGFKTTATQSVFRNVWVREIGKAKGEQVKEPFPPRQQGQ